MEDLIDLIAQGSAASEVSDQIKDILYAKAAERIDASRPQVAQNMFGEQEAEYEESEELDVEDTDEEDYSESEEDQE